MFALINRSLLGAILLGFAATVSAKPSLQPGNAAPPSFGSTADGTEVRAANLTGKIVIATFWASWCAPCRQEISTLARIRKAVPSLNMEIVAINYGEERRVFLQASKKLEATGLTITHDRNFRLSRPLGIKSIPYLLLIDPHGKVKHVHQGFGDKSLDTLLDEINIMLKQQHDDALQGTGDKSLATPVN